MVKAVSFNIVKPLECDWKEFDKILSGAQSQIYILANKAMQKLFVWEQFSIQHKKEHGVLPKLKEIHGYGVLSSWLYDELKDEVPVPYSTNISTTLHAICSKFGKDKKDIFTGQMSLPSYKENMPLDICKDGIKLKKMAINIVFLYHCSPRRGKKH